jgi:hypothetical protein
MTANDWFFDVPREKRWEDDQAWAEKHFGGELLDPGIIRVVRILKEAGVETYQSCEGPEGMLPEGRHGVGHSYHGATVDVRQPWMALDTCNAYGIRVDEISERFSLVDNRPVEHRWSVVLNSRVLAELRENWYRGTDFPAPTDA